MVGLFEKLSALLKQDKRFTALDGKILRNAVYRKKSYRR